ncbi:hypothetical protein ACP4OV_006148 [Aristida adscensionis]
MPCRLKREMAPPPQDLPQTRVSSDSAAVQQRPSMPGSCAPNPWWGAFPPPPPPAAAASTVGSSVPGSGPWCSTPFLPQQGFPGASAFSAWLAAASAAAATAAGSASALIPVAQKHAVDSELQELSMDHQPPGGFLGYFENPSNPQLTEQPPPCFVDGHKSKKTRSTSNSTARSQHPLIKVDNDDDEEGDGRIDRRLQWTKDEDLRLVSAWLNNSNDPIDGNCKKYDRYWKDVTDAYNSTTPKNRIRTLKQLKEHFHKIKKKVSWFCSAWKDANLVYASGQSDDQLMEKALAIYEADYKDGPFMFKYCWEVLRDQPKWHAYLDDLQNPNKRKLDDEGDIVENTPAFDLDEKRPMGTKTAKALRSGKGNEKDRASTSHMDEQLINKFIEVQSTANDGLGDMLETQKRVSSEKLEAAKLKHKSSMLETYRALIAQDTKDMPDDVKAEHMMGLKCLRESLFGKTD